MHRFRYPGCCFSKASPSRCTFSCGVIGSTNITSPLECSKVTKRPAVFLLLACGLAAQTRPGIFRIQPVRPVAELRAEALAAQPPRESGPFRPADLVELAPLDPLIKLDI